MSRSIAAAFLALLLGASLTACSSSSSNASSDNGAASASSDNGASSVNGVPAYPGATEVTNADGMGTPPPGGKAYTTAADPTKVKAWYVANVKGIKVVSDNGKQGLFMLMGDTKTGTGVVVITQNGKTVIGILPAASIK